MPVGWEPPSIHPDAQLVESTISLARMSGVTVFDTKPAEGEPLPPRPYAVAYSGLGVPSRTTIAPVSDRRDGRFQLTVVGDSPEQARWAMGQLRLALLDQRPASTSLHAFPLTITASQDVAFDEDVKSARVFFGVDIYRLAAVHA